MIDVSSKVGWIYKDKLLLELVFVRKKSKKRSVIASYFKNIALKNKVITINHDGNKYRHTTDNHGNLTIMLDNIPEGNFSFNCVYKSYEYVIHSKDFYKVAEGEEVVISDIDDTILRSHTLYPLKQLIHTLLPVKTRKVIPNVKRFLLEMDRRGRHVIFVSNSSMNLKHYLLKFMKSNDFPKGPLLLNNYQTIISLIKDKLKGKKHIIDYKKERIKRIISFLSGCNVGLVGDNSQQDPYIFLSIAKEYKERVDFIAVRKAILSPTEAIEEKYEENNLDIYMFDDDAEIDLKELKIKAE